MRSIITALCIFIFIDGVAQPGNPTANTGNYKIGIKVSVMKPGERFVFSIAPGKQVTVTEAGKLFFVPGTFPAGFPFNITQVSGPRPCTISPVSGNLPPTDMYVLADCPAPAGYSKIWCELRVPQNTTLTIQNNGANDYTVSTDNHNGINFYFPKPVPTGSSYNITVKSPPKGDIYKVTTIRGEPGIASDICGVRIFGDHEYSLISRGNGDSVLGTFFESWDAGVDKALGDEGRYLVFISQAKGLCGSSGNYRQIYWRDQFTGETQMISRAPDGTEGNANSFAPVISVGSMYVAFESYASNLVNDDGNKVRDVFLWSKVDGIKRVSTGAGRVEANAESFEPSVSGMGGQVAFSSSATNLTDDGAEVSGVNVYLWDKHTNKTILISKDPKTGKGVGGSKPSIDMNGYRIAFWSWAYTLVPDDKNNLWDIFLYERNTSLAGQPLRRITMAYDGGERNQGDESSSRVVTPTISGANGRFITYATTATNVVPDDNNKAQDVFVYDSETNTTTRVSVDNNGVEGNGDSPYGQGEKIDITASGNIVTFTTKASNFGTPAGNVVMYDLGKKQMIPVTANTNGYVSTPSISRDGSYVVFGSSIPLDIRFSSSGLFRACMKLKQ